jgi:hypothetical protein
MRHPFAPPLVRLRVRPDDPLSIPGRPRGSRRPHGDAAVAAVRKLIEQSTLTYSEIAERTGVGRASICRWTRDQNWRRPPFAPRATDTVPRARASAKLKRRLLAERLSALAARYVAELENSPGIDLPKLAEALMLMRMAKLAARVRRRRTGNARAILAGERTALDYEDAASLLKRLRSAGIDPEQTPEAALKLFIDAHAPERDFPEFRARGGKSRRVKEHRRMLGKYQK